MKRFLPLFALGTALIFTSCAQTPNHRTNYVAPSVHPLQQNVTNAQDKVTSAQAHSARSGTHISAASAKAKTATDRIKLIEKATEGTPTHEVALQVHTDLDDLTKELLDATNENAALQKDLTDTQTELRTAQGTATQLQAAIQTQTTQLNTANKDLNASIVQGAIDKHNAHLFKGIIIALAVGVVGLLVFSIFGVTSFAPPLLYVTVGAPTAVGVFLYFFLGSG